MLETIATGVMTVGFLLTMLFFLWIALEVLYQVTFRPFPHKPYVYLTVKKALTGDANA